MLAAQQLAFQTAKGDESVQKSKRDLRVTITQEYGIAIAYIKSRLSPDLLEKME